MSAKTPSDRPLPLGPGPIRNARAVLAVLTGLNLLNYVDRYVLSAVLPRLQDDLHLSNFVGGSLATVFLIGYFATSPIFGAAADARAAQGGGTRKRLMALGVAVWSAATVASGLARSAGSLVASRAVVGVGEASYATIAPTIIDDLAGPDRKGRWMSVFNAAMPIGAALGYVVGGAVEHARGWQAAFFVAGVPGFALAALCLLVAEPARTPQARARKADRLGATMALLRLPAYRRAVAGYCAYTFAIGGFAYWAPKYVSVRYGLEPGRASVAFGLVTLAAGFVGTVAGGWLADVAARRRSTRAAADPGARDTGDGAVVFGSLWVCALAAGLGAPLAAAAVLAPNARGFFGLVVPCEVALFLSSGPVNVALLRSVPAELRASAMALAIFAIHVLGDLWSPLLIGLAADHAPIEWAMLVAPVAFAAAAILWRPVSAPLTRTGEVR